MPCSAELAGIWPPTCESAQWEGRSPDRIFQIYDGPERSLRIKRRKRLTAPGPMPWRRKRFVGHDAVTDFRADQPVDGCQFRRLTVLENFNPEAKRTRA